MKMQAKNLVESRTKKEIRKKLQQIFGSYKELDAIDRKEAKGQKISEKELSLIVIAEKYMADLERAAIDRDIDEAELLLKIVDEEQKGLSVFDPWDDDYTWEELAWARF